MGKGSTKKPQVPHKKHNIPSIPPYPFCTPELISSRFPHQLQPTKFCHICRTSDHWNLMMCPNLSLFIPTGVPAEERLPHWVCHVCLSTEGISPLCHRTNGGVHIREICKVSGVNWLLCQLCPKHLEGHRWIKANHSPTIGFRNLHEMKEDLKNRLKHNSPLKRSHLPQ